MNITLTNFKYIKSLSKETNAFSANVIIDGKLAGTVSNHGHGGANMYNPFGLKTILDEYAKTLPPIKNKYFPNGLTQDKR